MLHGCILAIPKAPGYKAGMLKDLSSNKNDKDKSDRFVAFRTASTQSRFAICGAKR